MKTSFLNSPFLVFFFLAFQFCALSSFSQENRSGKEVKEVIEKLNKDMEKAFNDNDMVKVAAFYSDDAEISGDSYRVKGRKDLDKYWMDLKDVGRGWKLEVIEIGGEDDLVYQLGRSDLKYIRQGVEARAVTNFIVIWKIAPGGTYKIFRDYLTNTAFVKHEKR